MAKIESKRGSKVITTCPICGGKYTRAGLVGHMRFKHGRDWKAPMIPIEKPVSFSEARTGNDLLQRQLPPTPCCGAKFKLVQVVSTGKMIPVAGKMVQEVEGVWKCDSCGSLWQEHVSPSIRTKDGQVYLCIEKQLVRLP